MTIDWLALINKFKHELHWVIASVEGHNNWNIIASKSLMKVNVIMDNNLTEYTKII